MPNQQPNKLADPRDNGHSPYVQPSSSSHVSSYENSFSNVIRASDEAIDEKDRIPRFAELKMLQPHHPYFHDKRGYIIHFESYKRGEEFNHTLLYPRCQYEDKRNPHKQRKTKRSNNGRVVDRVNALVNKYGLPDLEFWRIIPTLPAEFRTWYANHPDKAKAQRSLSELLNRWWNQSVCKMDEQSTGLALWYNIHLFSSENPSQYHLHYDCITSNYRLVDDNFIKRDKFSSYMPYSKAQLAYLKRTWKDQIVKFAKRNGIPWDSKGKIDLQVAKETINYSETGFYGMFKHRLNYGGRKPLEDYYEYSENNLKCEAPTAEMENYKNKRHALGWFRQIGKLTADIPREKGKVFDVDGERMVRGPLVDMGEILRSDVGSLEIVRGIPVVSDLSEADKSRMILLDISYMQSKNEEEKETDRKYPEGVTTWDMCMKVVEKQRKRDERKRAVKAAAEKLRNEVLSQKLKL